jgi:predicted double-glycine peptidase
MPRLEALDATPKLRAILGVSHLADHLDDLVLGDETMVQFLDDVGQESRLTRAQLLSTDDNLRLEYATPRNNVPGRASTYETGAMLRAYGSSSVRVAHVVR